MTEKRKEKLLKQFGQVLAPNSIQRVDQPAKAGPITRESNQEVLADQIMAWLYSDLR